MVSIRVTLYVFWRFRIKIDRGLRRFSASPSHAYHGKNNLGLCPNLLGKSSPDPLIQLPNPSNPWGPPSPVGVPKTICFGELPRGWKIRCTSQFLNAPFKRSAKKRWSLSVRLPLTLTTYFSSPNNHFTNYSILHLLKSKKFLSYFF